MGFLIISIARILELAFTIYIFIVIARALISWVNPDPFRAGPVTCCSVASVVGCAATGGWIPLPPGGLMFFIQV